MEKTINWKNILGSIWFWWLVLTIIYTAFNFFGYPKSFSYNPHRYTYQDPYTHNTIYSLESLDHIAGLIGLFVPFGMTSLVLLAVPIFWLSIPVFFIGMYYANQGIEKHRVNGVSLIKG